MSIQALIASTAAATGIDAALLAAQAWQESAWNPLAVSKAGARGLMQFMPNTWTWAQEMGWIQRGANIHDPASSLTAGARFMGWLLARYRAAPDPLALALAAYNAGPGNVDKAIQAAGSSEWSRVLQKLPKPSETGPYVSRILDRRETYRGLFAVVKTAAPPAALGFLALLVVLALRRILA